MQKEIFGYLNKCIFRCDDAFFKQYPNYKLGKGVMILQEKRDATTGLWLKDKARFAMLGNLEIAAGEHTYPLKNYCNTLGILGLRFLVSMATYYSWKISKFDSKQAFQHTPTTRLRPDVVWLKKKITGDATDGYYYLTALFQGLPAASRGWFNFTAGEDDFLQKESCNMIPTASGVGIMAWSPNW